MGVGVSILKKVTMSRTNWQDRIDHDADLHHGDACIKGTRIPVAMIIGSLADGMTADEIQGYYPQLTSEDIQAVLPYATTTRRRWNSPVV